MKAVVLYEYGDAGKLRYEDVPTPEPNPTQVLIKTAATSINPIDNKIRSGAMKAMAPVQFPYILGRDVSGEIVKVGSEVTSFEPGQRVMSYVPQTYAEFVAADQDAVAILPEGLDVEKAAALPVVLTTGAQLIEHVHPKSGETVLVTGAVGSVGRTAVFVARQYGARVLAGVRRSQKEEAASLGAEQVVAIDDDAEIQSLPQLDAIADTVGGETIGKLLPKLKRGGILGSLLGKPKAAEGLDVHVEAFSAEPDPDRLQQLARAIVRGEFRIPIARQFKLSEAAEAQRFAESGSAGGKVLLVP